MIRKRRYNAFFIIVSLFAGIAASCSSRQNTSGIESADVVKMAGFPQEESGFSLGVSACYAGQVGEQLLIAGGCNFPETPASKGGKKRFYNGIYTARVTTDSTLMWHRVGELPVAAAYGYSITTSQGVICVGGSNEHGALSTVYRLSLKEEEGTVLIDTLPSLPCTMDNLSGALLGNNLFVAGGNVNGKPSNAFYQLSLDHLSAGWQLLTEFPGSPRVQPVCVAQQGCVFLWGGFSGSFDGHPATLSTSGYCYSPASRQWKQIATPTDKEATVLSLGGGAGIAVGDSMILCVGGVHKDVFFSALQREEKLKAALATGNRLLADSLQLQGKTYLLQSPESYRFNDRILLYNVNQDCWKEVARHPGMARAGASLVGEGFTYYSINGELKPGIRTPEINKIKLRN